MRSAGWTCPPPPARRRSPRRSRASTATRSRAPCTRRARSPGSTRPPWRSSSPSSAWPRAARSTCSPARRAPSGSGRAPGPPPPPRRDSAPPRGQTYRSDAEALETAPFVALDQLLSLYVDAGEEGLRDHLLGQLPERTGGETALSVALSAVEEADPRGVQALVYEVTGNLEAMG